MDFFSYIIINFLFSLKPAIDCKISSTKNANRNTVLELVEYFLGDLHMFFLELEELMGNNNALIVYFMAKMLKVSFSYLHSCFICTLLCLFSSLLLYHLALLFVYSPMLITMLACTIFGNLTISTNK